MHAVPRYFAVARRVIANFLPDRVRKWVDDERVLNAAKTYDCVNKISSQKQKTEFVVFKVDKNDDRSAIKDKKVVEYSSWQLELRTSTL